MHLYLNPLQEDCIAFNLDLGMDHQIFRKGGEQLAKKVVQGTIIRKNIMQKCDH